MTTGILGIGCLAFAFYFVYTFRPEIKRLLRRRAKDRRKNH